MLVSGVQQCDSFLHIRISTLFFFFRFFSHIGHYRVLSRVPCAVPYPQHFKALPRWWWRDILGGWLCSRCRRFQSRWEHIRRAQEVISKKEKVIECPKYPHFLKESYKYEKHQSSIRESYIGKNQTKTKAIINSGRTRGCAESEK